MDITRWKMPKLRKCCFCVSLSTGFLVWGYFNLVYHILLFALGVFIGIVTTALFGLGGVMPPLEITILLPALLFCIGVYSLLIVIAGHSNNLELLRAVFIAGTILWIFEVLYSPCLAPRMISFYRKEGIRPAAFALCLIPVIIEPFLQGYVLLLLRSMILKLQEQSHGVEYTNFDINEVESGDEGYFPNESYQPLFKK